MAVPKAKVSRQRRDKRRTRNSRLDMPNLSKCPKCGEPIMSHRACKACGTYNGRVVIPAVAEAK